MDQDVEARMLAKIDMANNGNRPPKVDSPFITFLMIAGLILTALLAVNVGFLIAKELIEFVYSDAPHRGFSSYFWLSVVAFGVSLVFFYLREVEDRYPIYQVSEVCVGIGIAVGCLSADPGIPRILVFFGGVAIAVDGITRYRDFRKRQREAAQGQEQADTSV